MDRKELEEKVLELVSMAYNRSVAELTVGTSFKEDLGGASVQMVALVAQIENELDATLMLADASACKTISELVDLVENEL